jgi:hypothetical protein
VSRTLPRTRAAAFPPAARSAIALLAVAALGACTGKSRYARDGDTGAAAPATVRDMSATPNAPDSTAGVSRPTGRPGAAGDTLGSGKGGASPVGAPRRTPAPPRRP